MILMQQNFNAEELETLSKINYLAGSLDTVELMKEAPSKEPFSDEILEFLNLISRELMDSKEARSYPDVVTLGFWLRKSNITKLKESYYVKDDNIHLGRGIAFHIAPSNVPVNFAYSLFSGLMTGNRNIVRVPSKDFQQVRLIVNAIKKVLEYQKDFEPYIVLVRYGREREINDVLSSIADTRIIWGGDATIADIRKSPLAPRGTEITFADRFSLSILDSDCYIEKAKDGKAERIAQDFYNDTYLSDQNACTSPRLIVWTGSRKEEAKEIFWDELHKQVVCKYEFQTIMAVNKWTSLCLAAVHEGDLHVIKTGDNLITRIQVKRLTRDLIDLRENCGFFYEYDTDNLMELREICDDNRVQTLGMLGSHDAVKPLLKSGVRGIDRVTDIGKTMDFDLIWDGYNLADRLTRIVRI